MKMKESQIQSGILFRLAHHPRVYVITRAKSYDPIEVAAAELEAGSTDVVLWRQNTGGAKLKGRGGVPRHVAFNLPGAPDIFGFGPFGRAVGLEVKTPKGKLSDTQRVFQRMIEGAGGFYAVVRTPDEAIAAIDRMLEEQDEIGGI